MTTCGPIADAIKVHRQNLDVLRIQAAQYGIDMPVRLRNSIAHEERRIIELQAELDEQALDEMPPGEAETAYIEKQLVTFRGNLARLELLSAKYGVNVPFSLQNEIDFHRRKIAELDSRLDALYEITPSP